MVSQYPYQFHSQECMMEFLQRADIMAQILPIIVLTERSLSYLQRNLARNHRERLTCQITMLCPKGLEVYYDRNILQIQILLVNI